MPVPAVFIASPSGLETYRNAVAAACQTSVHFALRMEQFEPAIALDIEKCRAYIDECDLFVLLLAHHYGSRPHDESASFTELEFDHAVKRGKPIISFLIDPDYPWPATQDEKADDIRALERFKERVRRHGGATLFGDLQDFERRVSAALGGRRAKREGTGWAVLTGSGHMPTLTFGTESYIDPRRLAEAISVSTDWDLARRTFGGEGRLRLADWLRGEGADASYRAQAEALVGSPTSNAETTERILDFIAHFAPNIPATFEGRPAGARELAVNIEQAAGHSTDVSIAHELTESMLRSLSAHPCRPRHAECGDSGGCEVLANAWNQFQDGLSEISRQTARLRAAGHAVERQVWIEAHLRLAVLDSAYGDRLLGEDARLPIHDVDWWQPLIAQENPAPSRSRRIARALLKAELAGAAQAADDQRRAEEARIARDAEERQRQAAEAAAAVQLAAEQFALQQQLAAEREQLRAVRGRADSWFLAILICAVLLSDLPATLALRAATTHWERGPDPLIAILAALLVFAPVVILALFGNRRLLPGRGLLNSAAVVAIVLLLAVDVWLAIEHGWAYGAHRGWMIWVNLLLLVLAAISAVAAADFHVDLTVPAALFVLPGLLGALPLVLLIAGLGAGGHHGHVGAVLAGALLLVAALGVVCAGFKRTVALSPWLGGGLLLAEIPFVGAHIDLITTHWYWTFLAFVAALLWIVGASFVALYFYEELG